MVFLRWFWSCLRAEKRPLASGFSWETANRSSQLCIWSFTLPRFQILARRSVQFSSFLFSQNIIQHKNTYRNCKLAREARKHQKAYEAWASWSQRKKNLAINHLPLEASPAVQTWTTNCKRDCKAVVTWHSAVCGLWFSMKNLMLKVSNMCALCHRYCQIQIFVWGGELGTPCLPPPPAPCLMLWKSFKIKPSQMAK